MKLTNKRFYTLLTGLIIALFWVITFLCRRFEVNNEIIVIIEGIELVILGSLIGFTFFYFEELFYSLPLICYLPFVFSRSFDILTIPPLFYVAIVLAGVGIIGRFFRHKFTFKFGKMFFGLALFGLSLILGGINVKENEYRLTQFIMMIIVSCGLLAVYSILVSGTKKVEFNVIACLMHVFALILLTQELTYYIAYPDHLDIKKMSLGWGVGNSLGLMFLFSMPFSYYSAIKHTNYKRYLYILYTVLQYLGIVFAYSRGSILIGGIGLLLMLIFGFYFFKDDLKRHLLIILGAVVLIVLLLFIIYLFDREIFASIDKIILEGFHFDVLNNRIYIYQKWTRESMNYPIFGHGIYYPFISWVDVKDAYQWGHSTFLHALYTTGILGTVLLTYHMVEKYYGLLKNINLEKFVLLFGLVLSGTYGLFDVSYFYINYMIVLLVVLVISDDYFERLIKFKFIK